MIEIYTRNFDRHITVPSPNLAFLCRNLDNVDNIQLYSINQNFYFYGNKNLFILSNFRSTIKAVDSAINSRQWNKAVHILEVVQDQSTTSKYYKKIAEHYARVGEYEVSSNKTL